MSIDAFVSLYRGLIRRLRGLSTALICFRLQKRIMLEVNARIDNTLHTFFYRQFPTQLASYLLLPLESEYL